MNPVTTLADAISQLEGTNPVYNNPGAISGTGDTGQSFGAGIGIYSTLSAGQAALQNQLDLVYGGSDSLYPGGSNMTLSQFGQAYENNPSSTYGTTLAQILGVPASTPLSAITPYSGSSTTASGSTSGSTSGAEQSWWQQVINPNNSSILPGYVPGAQGGYGAPVAGSKISVQNIVVILIGIILIGAGLFSFKQTQNIITTGGNIVRRGAELASA